MLLAIQKAESEIPNSVGKVELLRKHDQIMTILRVVSREIETADADLPGS
jgi:hypothetical protein